MTPRPRRLIFGAGFNAAIGRIKVIASYFRGKPRMVDPTDNIKLRFMRVYMRGFIGFVISATRLDRYCTKFLVEIYTTLLFQLRKCQRELAPYSKTLYTYTGNWQ